jgi:acyl-CoA thioesterase
MTPQALAEACAAAMWAEDRASAGLGMRIARVAPGEAALTMRVEERMVNGHGVVPSRRATPSPICAPRGWATR